MTRRAWPLRCTPIWTDRPWRDGGVPCEGFNRLLLDRDSASAHYQRRRLGAVSGVGRAAEQSCTVVSGAIARDSARAELGKPDASDILAAAAQSHTHPAGY